MNPKSPFASSEERVRELASEAAQNVLYGRNASRFSIRDTTVPEPALGPAATQRETPVWFELDEQLLNGPLDAYIERDPHPLPATADREGYHEDRHLDYWLSGLADYLAIRRAAAKHGLQLAPGDGVLDMGCASGRVLRHFLAQEQDLELWGVDINSRHVDWLRQNIAAPKLKVFQNSVLPSLPIADGSLSVVYAFSVFTHIDEFELAWLAELRRVLRPGGIAYLTIHSQDTWAGLNPHWSIYNGLLAMNEHIAEYDVTEEFLAQPMPGERFVFEWRNQEHNNTNVFHHTDYIRDAWGRFLDVQEIVQQGSGYQDVVVLRRPR